MPEDSLTLEKLAAIAKEFKPIPRRLIAFTSFAPEGFLYSVPSLHGAGTQTLICHRGMEQRLREDLSKVGARLVPAEDGMFEITIDLSLGPREEGA